MILAFARVTNFALVLFSPILMVRILDTASFGQFREFMAYGMLIASLAAFSIKSNLLYFIPHKPDYTRQYVAHTNWLSFAASLLACAILFLAGDFIRSKTSFDFLVPLIIYVLLFSNLTYLETFFVATKKPKSVLYFSVARTVVRLTAVIGTAYITRSVAAIVYALLAVETTRIIAVLILTKRLKILSFSFDRKIVKEQIGFILPLGLAGSLTYMNQYIGQIIISSQLGVVALAIYAIGSYKLPVVRLIRGAISDAIFPNMVKEASGDTDRLRLWKRGNIAYTFLVLPIFTLLFWYADVLIPFAFTDKYEEAVPIFRIFLLWMPIQCIELSSPLRAANKTGTLLVGNVLMLGTNLLCIFVFFRYFKEFALFGPAVGTVLGHLLQHVFMAWRIIRHFSIELRELLKWRSQSVIVLCTAMGCIVLYLGDMIPMPDLVRVPIFSAAYAGVYFFLLRRYNLEEVNRVIQTFGRRLKRKRA